MLRLLISFRRFALAGLCLFAAAAASAAPQDDACLACHGEKGFKSESGRNISVDPARHKASVHAALGCTACHAGISEYPHPKKVAKPDCSTCHSDAVSDVPKSIHGALFSGSDGREACQQCHGSPHEIRKVVPNQGQLCATCHADAVKEYQGSIHAAMRKGGNADGPLCASCHGPAHKVLPRSDAASPVAKKNLANTCGTCHSNPDFLARHQIGFARPVEAFRLSIHGRAVERGNDAAPSCSECHGSHAILKASNPRSRINHFNVPNTCGACHADIRNVYVTSVHGQAALRGVRNSPVCTDCHGEHNILAKTEPGSLVNPARVSTVTCGHCHNDERLIDRFNLPRDQVPTFRDSFHGLSSRTGRQTVANCASCHGVHNILPSSDPRSSIHPANLAATCGSCHPGAGQRFALGPVHVKTDTATEHPVVRFIRVSYLYMIIPFAIGFMLLHNLLDWLGKLVRGVVRHPGGEEVPRMNRWFRIAHWLVQISFVTLVVTGFALKYPESWWAAPFLSWESQVPMRGWIHRIAACVMLGALAFHAVHLALRRRDRVILPNLLPKMQDLRDLVQFFRYNLRLTEQRPQFGMFSYGEKIEYLAFMWGTVVMSLTGFLLWFENFTLRYFPLWVVDASTALHWYEAILATAAIVIWHFYGVMFDPEVYPMDKAWLTGKASAEHLRHTRPAYYAELMRRLHPPAPEPAPAADPAPASAQAAAKPADSAKPSDAAKTSDSPAPPKDKPGT